MTTTGKKDFILKIFMFEASCRLDCRLTGTLMQGLHYVKNQNFEVLPQSNQAAGAVVKEYRMKTGVYVIFDKVAEECGPIFEAKNDAVAYRSFAKLRDSADSPGDFKLLKLGLFNHETCKALFSDEPIDVVEDVIIEEEEG